MTHENKSEVIKDETVWVVYKTPDKVFDSTIDHPDKARDVLKYLREDRGIATAYALEKTIKVVRTVDYRSFE